MFGKNDIFIIFKAGQFKYKAGLENLGPHHPEIVNMWHKSFQTYFAYIQMKRQKNERTGGWLGGKGR